MADELGTASTGQSREVVVFSGRHWRPAGDAVERRSGRLRLGYGQQWLGLVRKRRREWRRLVGNGGVEQWSWIL
jgi:hypothetical protein